MWIKDLFKIPTLYVNENERYFGHFFSNILNILDCKFKTPREIHWKGHPFYFNLLKTLEFISQSYPKNVEHLLSMPLWFNSCLNTKYDVELSRAGFNFLKDLFPSNQLLEMNEQNVLRLSPPKRRSLIQIIQKIPAEWGDRILEEAITNVTVLPTNTIQFNSSDTRVDLLSSKSIYSILIDKKSRLPRGLLHWCEDLQLSDSQIKTAFTFAHICTSHIFTRVFQYKIVTQILPTNEYLKRYRVRDSELCCRCGTEIDTVLHSTWTCVTLVPYITHVINYIRTDCIVGVDITMITYIFGFPSNMALNQILLELKKELFYNYSENVNIAAFLLNFKTKIMHLIIKEKRIALLNDSFESFADKWKDFSDIYDFMGPDCQIMY